MTTLVACIGDSITEGLNAANPYPAQLSQLLGPSYLVSNYGASGTQLAAIQQSWRQFVYGCGYSDVCLLGGINDIIQSGTAGSVVLAALTALYDEIRGQGLLLIPATLLPFHGYSGWTSGKQTDADTVNTGIRSYCTSNSLAYCDLYVSMASGGDATALNAAYDSGDGLHPNEAGNAVMAAAWRALIP